MTIYTTRNGAAGIVRLCVSLEQLQIAAGNMGRHDNHFRTVLQSNGDIRGVRCVKTASGIGGLNPSSERATPALHGDTAQCCARADASARARSSGSHCTGRLSVGSASKRESARHVHSQCRV